MAPEPKKKVSMPVEAEYSFLGDQRAVGQGVRLKSQTSQLITSLN